MSHPYVTLGIIAHTPVLYLHLHREPTGSSLKAQGSGGTALPEPWFFCLWLVLWSKAKAEIQTGKNSCKKQIKQPLFGWKAVVLWNWTPIWIFSDPANGSESAPNRPSGWRRFCAVQTFWPKAKTLAQGNFISPEHVKSLSVSIKITTPDGVVIFMEHRNTIDATIFKFGVTFANLNILDCGLCRKAYS